MSKRSMRDLLELLTGETATLNQTDSTEFPDSGLGYSQINELLLHFGFDRITLDFFQFLASLPEDEGGQSEIKSEEYFVEAIAQARELFLLFFGNVKFGFKKMARNADDLYYYLSLYVPIVEDAFTQRHAPVFPIKKIDPSEAYFLGYLVDKEVRKQLQESPNDEEALARQAKMLEIRKIGTLNHNSYLVSDHLDVYVATSMRQRHEYEEIADFTHRLFHDGVLKKMNLRWFDPTLAYCHDRIDKGLSEALMLKRAQCTLYLAQESDTFGKDSELASTLAQGKPVVAYVPSPTRQQVIDQVKKLAKLYSQDENKVILDRLKALAPTMAWESREIRNWVENPNQMKIDEGLQVLVDTAEKHYNRRAETLKNDHPLGIQVNLDSGVANGVLVVRSVEQCAELIKRILTRTLTFQIKTEKIGDCAYEFLVEDLSGCTFRVMTGDAMLTNSFWNFYLEGQE